MEGIGRLSIFIVILLLMIAWEILSPRRKLIYTRWRRWSENIGISVLNMVIMRFTIAGAALFAASSAQEHGWGLLNSIELPIWLVFILSIVLLDLAIYGQHRASHHFALLWRLHKVHHTDLEFDVTTAIRFHPIEILLSMIYKVICIYIIGVQPIAVIAFEVILSSCALFNHSNIYIPKKIDTLLRLFIVTPDMHRIHHSVIQSETDSNYGFSISVWDRLFASYTEQPRNGHQDMAIGLTHYRVPKELSLQRLLILPFKQK